MPIRVWRAISETPMDQFASTSNTLQPPLPSTLPSHARNTLDMLLSRRSRWPLTGPGPTVAEIDIILDVGLRAPDNGRLLPWRFIVIRDSAREAFGDLLVEISASRDPDRPLAEHEQRRQRALAAPLIVALGAAVTPHSPIPKLEQLLAVGAAAMNMLNAVHALGYGGYWTSGPDCHEPELLEALGLQDQDGLLGFLYIGTPDGPPPTTQRPLRENHVVDFARLPERDHVRRAAIPAIE
jgi:nitroreductase